MCPTAATRTRKPACSAARRMTAACLAVPATTADCSRRPIALLARCRACSKGPRGPLTTQGRPGGRLGRPEAGCSTSQRRGGSESRVSSLDLDIVDPGPPEVQEVSPGVYAYVQPDGTWWINNTGFLV